MIRRIFATVALLTAIGVVLTLPPASLTVTVPAGATPVVRGVIHVHTTQSDGSGSPDAVAAAARGAGLSFVILTDHGDGTRAPAPPRYSAGVLVIDAVEISTARGHVVALDLPRAPYPFRGEPEDVLDDIRRLGGMSIVAHPTSRKNDLKWDESGQLYDGIEWLNGDSEWRDEPPLALARVLASYWFRPPESLAAMLDRPAAALALWDRVATTRAVVGIAGADAHAKIGGDLDHGGPAALNLPGYEQSFRTFSIGLPGVTLSGAANADGRAVSQAIRTGHLFTTIDAFAHPARIALTARIGEHQVEAGDRLPSGQPVTIHADLDAPASAPQMALYRNGVVVTTVTGRSLDYAADGSAAVYRVEATLPEPRSRGAEPAPWLVTNPIYVGAAPSRPDRPAPTTIETRSLERADPSWVVEHSTRSTGAVGTVRAVGGTQTSMRYALGGARSDGPFVAFATPLPAIGAFTRLTFVGRANKPTRVSLQLRAPAEQGSGRWRKSVYLDDMARAVTLELAEFRAVQPGLPARPPLEDVLTLLVVVDDVNTALGLNGEVWLDDVALAR